VILEGSPALPQFASWPTNLCHIRLVPYIVYHANLEVRR